MRIFSVKLRFSHFLFSPYVNEQYQITLLSNHIFVFNSPLNVNEQYQITLLSNTAFKPEFINAVNEQYQITLLSNVQRL